MSLTDAQFVAWLKSADCIRCALVEVQARVAGTETTLYLSNRNYVTATTDTPASTAYEACVVGGVRFSEALSLDGQPSLSWGDIELDNTGGVRDSWLNNVWANRQVRVFIGDPRWPRGDFRLVFDGIVGDLGARSADVLNLRLLDKLQRLNAPLYETALGGTTANVNQLLPLTFGECHNVTPLLRDPATLEYQVHDGVTERLIEVRDNGAPVTATAALSTGRFTLAAAPAGTVTASVQGAAASVNLVPWSDDFTKSTWTRTRLTVTPAATMGPDGVTPASKFTETSTTASTHLISTVALAVAPSAPYALNVVARAAERTALSLRTLVNGVFVTAAVVNLAAGTQLSGGSTAVIVDLGSGWYWISYSLTTAADAVTLTQQVNMATNTGALTYAGDGASGLYVLRAWINEGPYGVMAAATGAAAAGIYINTISEIVKRVVTAYGPAATRFTAADLDLARLNAFGVSCPQPVGLYASERVNLLAACQQLAASVGAQVVVTSQGLLRLVRLALPATAATTITADDIEYHGISIADRPDVRAACKLAYCKNWTPQASGLASGLPPDSADLFAREWLIATAADAAAAELYKLGSQPVQEETLLLTDADALAEAQRRRDLWSTPRTVFELHGLAHLLLTELGDAVSVVHARYGLSAGKVGQVVRVERDWLGGRATLGVLA